MAKPNKNYEWYAALNKPRYAPPAWLFGLVWSVLYGVIGFSYLYIIRRIFAGDLPQSVVLPMGLNLAFNMLYAPIQFRLKRNLLALADIVLLIVTLVWLMILTFSRYPILTYANLPYLGWAVFALVLQWSIVRLNKRT